MGGPDLRTAIYAFSGSGFLCLLLAVPLQRAAAQQRPAERMPTPGAALPFGIEPADPGAERASVPANRQDDRSGRYTKRGLIIGAIAGGVAGAGFGAFIALFCEVEGDGCTSAVPLVGLLGAASGAALGAIIGAAIPRRGDEPADTVAAPPGEPAEEVSPRAARPAEARRIGALGVTTGRASGTVESWTNGEIDGAGPLLRLTLAAELRPWFAIGPEVGQAWLGNAGRVRHAAVAVRATWPAHPLSPFVSGNVGAYDATEPSREFLGGGIGLGARFTPRRGQRWFVDIEARRSGNIQNIEPVRLTELSLGGGVYW